MGQKEIMPDASKAKMEFDDWSKMLSPPFAIYSDIEAILEKSDDDTKILQTHVPCAVGSYLVAHKSIFAHLVAHKFSCSCIPSTESRLSPR